MHAFNWIDYSIIGIVVLSTVISLMRGLVREILSLATWLIAFIFAFKFFASFSGFLESYINNPSLRRAVAFAVIFGALLLIGSIISHLLSQLIIKTGLRGPDRALGMIFGFLRGIIVIGVLLLLVSLSAWQSDKKLKDSYLVPYFKPMVTWLQNFLPDKMNDLSDSASKQADNDPQ